MLLAVADRMMSNLNKICKQYINQLQILSSNNQRHKPFNTLFSQGDNQISGDLYGLPQRQNEITILLVQMQDSQFLSHREIPVFDGDPLQFKSFIKAFEHCVEAKTNDKGDCLYYLKQFTKGQPRNLVRSCLHMATERGYIVTKNLLEEHFGNGLMVTAAYKEKITGWPSVKSEDTKGLQAHALYLRECSNAMEELQYLEGLKMPANMKIVIQKLPYKLREQWRVKACEILDRDNQRACFIDIVKFIEQWIRIASDCSINLYNQSLVIYRTPHLVKGESKASLKSNRSKINSFATHVSITDERNADARKSDRVQR